jgi:hypothetical protein
MRGLCRTPKAVCGLDGDGQANPFTG